MTLIVFGTSIVAGEAGEFARASASLTLSGRVSAHAAVTIEPPTHPRAALDDSATDLQLVTLGEIRVLTNATNSFVMAMIVPEGNSEFDILVNEQAVPWVNGRVPIPVGTASLATTGPAPAFLILEIALN